MKDLRSMTVREIKSYMQENNIKISRAYKMRKEELIKAIEKAIRVETTLMENKDNKEIIEEKLTALEVQVLDEISQEDGNGDCILDSELEVKQQYLSILNITLPTKQLRGVLSSLVKKGYIEIYDDEEGYDSILRITNKYIKYYRQNLKTTKEDPMHPVEENEVKIEPEVLNFIEDGTKIIVKVKDFKDKNKYFTSDIGVLETDHGTGYKSIKIKNSYRTRHVSINNNNKNIDFFISKDDFMKFSLKLLEKEKNYKKSKKIVACRC